MKILTGPNTLAQGYTYFARASGDGPIKIGSTLLGFRHRQGELRWQGEKPAPILIVTGQNLELRFHAAFEPHHLGHEWFQPAPELLLAISNLHNGTFDWSTLPEHGWCVTKPFQVKASLAHWGPLPRFAALPEAPGRIGAAA